MPLGRHPCLLAWRGISATTSPAPVRSGPSWSRKCFPPAPCRSGMPPQRGLDSPEHRRPLLAMRPKLPTGRAGPARARAAGAHAALCLAFRPSHRTRPRACGRPGAVGTASTGIGATCAKRESAPEKFLDLGASLLDQRPRRVLGVFEAGLPSAVVVCSSSLLLCLLFLCLCPFSRIKIV